MEPEEWLNPKCWDYSIAGDMIKLECMYQGSKKPRSFSYLTSKYGSFSDRYEMRYATCITVGHVVFTLRRNSSHAQVSFVKPHDNCFRRWRGEKIVLPFSEKLPWELINQAILARITLREMIAEEEQRREKERIRKVQSFLR